jgi:hypothetical protein
MAKEGKCTRANCEYSHDQRDLDEFKKKRPMKRAPAAEVAEAVRRAPAAEVAEALEAACRQEGLRMARCERSARVPLCGPTLGV